MDWSAYMVLSSSLLLLFIREDVDGECQSATVCNCNFADDATKSVSSNFSFSFSANHSGINSEFTAISVNGSQKILIGGAWVPAEDDPSPWFQADIGALKTIRQISTRGSTHFESWVKEYNVFSKITSSSSFSKRFKLEGNKNNHQLAVRNLGDQKQFEARFIKIVPLSFERQISMRIEITGCDKVHGAWTNWEGWRNCRKPCGGGLQFRFRECKNPEPRFFGNNCPGSSVDQQPCNEHACPPTTMTIDLHLPSETWNVSTSEPTTVSLCADLESNFSAVYSPSAAFNVTASCEFYQWDTTKVGAIVGLLLSEPNALYIVELQDNLHYHDKIHNKPAILANYSSTIVPYPPSVVSFNSPKHTYVDVQITTATTGPTPDSFMIFYRLDTTDPDGAWSYQSQESAYGPCDSYTSCTIHTASFHNYTTRVVPYNEIGFGFGSQPFLVRAMEDVPATPANFVGVMVSSKSITVSWSILSLASMNGNSLGYEIHYKPKYYGHWQINTVSNHWTNQLLISGLEEYVWYRAKIRAKNSRFTGDFSPHIEIQTDEDIPSAPPPSLALTPASSTSLRVSWSEIPSHHKNGIITNYQIKIALGTLMANSSIFTVVVSNGNQYEQTVPGLIKWTHYTAQIAASTVKGTSAFSASVTSRTSEDIPDVIPADLRGNNISATAILLQWNNSMPILPRNGIIIGYRVACVATMNPTDSRIVDFHGGSLQTGSVTGLQFWTHYNLSIAAGTRIGYGTFSSPITVRTDEHVPTGHPVILSAFNTSSYKINVTWDPIRNAFEHGIILGYNITYTSLSDGAESYLLFPVARNLGVEINNLRNFTAYNLTISGYNIKGTGPCSWTVVMTEESVPTQPPASILTYNTSSSSLWIEWSKVPLESRRGYILGYFIVYHDVVYNVTRNLTLNGENTLSHNLAGLEEFRQYKISITGFTKFGIGPYISAYGITDQGIPTSAPVEIKGTFLSSNEIKISWSKPPGQDQNGELVSVNVFYKLDIRAAPTRAVDGRAYFEMLQAKNSSAAMRRRRSVEDVFSYLGNKLHVTEKGIIDSHYAESTLIQRKLRPASRSFRIRRSTTSPPGFNTIVLTANETDLQINSLDPYINYTIILQATTMKGSGPLSNPILVQTDETVPSSPPTYVSANYTSSRSMLTKWQPIPHEDANGIVYAYIISIQRANSFDPWQNHIQYEPNLHYNVTGLMRFVVYEVKVAGITSKGIGPFSKGVLERTDEDIPSKAPANVKAESLASTVLRISWDSVPENGEPSCCLHGILTGYRISYGKRFPVPGDSFTSFTVPPKQQLVDIGGLETYTPYIIDVAAMTVKGLGPDGRTHAWTSESRPIMQPLNVSVVNHTSTSLMVEWNELPFLMRKGDIQGYALYYRVKKSSHSLSVKWIDMDHFTANYTVVYRPPIQIEIDDVLRRLWYELTGLYKFMEYAIHLTAYTKIGTGPWTFALSAMTDEDVPSRAASNITVQSPNSTSIIVQWDPVPIIYDPSIEDPVCCTNGILTGYTIFYKRERKNTVYNRSIDLSYFEGMNGTDSLHNSTRNTTNSTQPFKMSYTLTDLDPYKNYSVYVAGNTRTGHGELGNPNHVLTQQDLPARGPIRVEAWNTSSTSLHVEWEELEWEYRNGIVLDYTVYYRETSQPLQQEATITVSSTRNSTQIRKLQKWTFYDIRVYARTVVGQGLDSTNVTVRTDTDIPTKSPQDLVATDNTGPFSLLLKWKPVPPAHRHGDILSYKILFRKYTEADRPVEQSKMSELVVSSNTHETYLENLATFTTYEIQIVARTNKGYGAHSNIIYSKTCRCVKQLYTNWWAYPPYVFEEGINGTDQMDGYVPKVSFVPKGIFGEFIRDMVIWGCQDCNGPRGHGLSVVHFDVDKNGRKSMKGSIVECIRGVSNATDISFPIQGLTKQTDFLSKGRFLHLIDHPGSALVVLKKVTIISKTKAMTKAMLSLWPMVILILVFAALAGNVIWFLDSTANPDELPPSPVLVGMWNGLWWAYVTMTTVGYGDITPKSYIGKVFALIWTFVGLVLYAILCSGLTSSLYVKEQVINKKVDIYDTMIAAKSGTFEEKMIAQRAGKLLAKNGVAEALQMVRKNEVEGALIDSFVLTMFQRQFNNSPIYVQKSVKSSFAFGVGLTGNISKLADVFTDFINSNQKRFTDGILNYVHVFKTDESTAVTSDEESTGMFQPNSPMFLNTAYTIAACIGVAFVFGSIYMVWRNRREKEMGQLEMRLEKLRVNSKAYGAMETLFSSMNDVSENFVTSLEERLAKIDDENGQKFGHLINIHRFLNRCERNGVNPRRELSQHGISIHHWDVVNRERKRYARLRTQNYLKKISKCWFGRRIVPSRVGKSTVGSDGFSSIPGALNGESPA